jgi:hypothetical protein
MALLFSVKRGNEITSYEFGGLTITFASLAAIGTFLAGCSAFGNFLVTLAGKLGH